MRKDVEKIGKVNTLTNAETTGKILELSLFCLFRRLSFTTRAVN